MAQEAQATSDLIVYGFLTCFINSDYSQTYCESMRLRAHLLLSLEVSKLLHKGVF